MITIYAWNRTKGHAVQCKSAQKGMTLIEVLVSLMVLSIGIMALLATQLRSVTGVREAEVQTIVAQATQNLAEGMLANATLVKGDDKTTKSYADYHNKTESCGDGSVSVALPIVTSGQTSGNEVDTQLKNFACSLRSSLPPDTEFSFRTCYSNDAPKINEERVTVECADNGSQKAYIAVVWKTRPGGASAAGTAFSYQVQVAE